MHIPFPRRIAFVFALLFATLICVLQLYQRTSATFSLCCFFYILVATIAFNVAGGFTRTSGAFIFFNSVLCLIVGLCVKIYLGEPGDSNLFPPILTIGVYLVGMCMMLVAAYLSRRFSSRVSLMGKLVSDQKLQVATVGCLVAGILMTVATSVGPLGNGSVLSALISSTVFTH